MASITIDNVSVIFGDNSDQALAIADAGGSRAHIAEKTGSVLGIHNCSLTVAEGEIVVLMGLSGSGKSTLLRTLNRLNRISRGRIEVEHNGDKIDIGNASFETMRQLRTKLVSMVFQQFGLLPWRSVAENVGFGLELAGVPKAERKKIVQEQLQLVGLQDWSQRLVGELSGGMQQRVGIARAFSTGAPILLMDEPYSALDPLIRNHLQDELLSLRAQFNKTLVFVSHDLDEAIKMGNRIVIMEDGRILQCGTAKEIVLNPANDYVAQFVRHINPLNFLTANDIMRSLSDKVALPVIAREVAPSTYLKDVLGALEEKNDSLGVVENGKLMGIITANEIIYHLTQHQKR